jgi:hypothetical protein
MGLLDKSKDLDSTEEPAGSTISPPKVAVKVATRAVPKVAKPAKAAKAAKPARAKRERGPRPHGLPAEFELAGTVSRFSCWFVNFIVNFGLIIGTLPLLMFDSGGGGTGITTYMLIGAIVAIISNAFILPIWAGRNVGQFVSRTKFVNSSGKSPLFIHSVMNSSLGLLSLMGFFVVFTQFQDIQDNKTSLIWFIVGAVFIILWFVNWSIKRNHEMKQGLFDLLFSSYLITHTPTGSATGWLARLEGLGDFGDKYEKRVEAREEKAAKKEAKSKLNTEAAVDSEEDTESEEKSAKKSTEKDAKK